MSATEIGPEQVVRLLEVFPRLMRMVGSTVPPHGEELGFRSLTQLHVVKHLAERPWLVSELAQEMRLSVPTVSVAVDGMVRRGLVERGEASDDRRANPLTLTPQGVRCYEMARQHVIAALERVLEQVPAEDRAALFQGLSAVAKVLETASSNTEACACPSTGIDSKELGL